MSLNTTEIRDVNIFRDSIISYVINPNLTFDKLVETALAHLGPNDRAPITPRGWFAVVVNNGSRVVERELGGVNSEFTDLEVLIRANTVIDRANLL